MISQALSLFWVGRSCFIGLYMLFRRAMIGENNSDAIWFVFSIFFNALPIKALWTDVHMQAAYTELHWGHVHYCFTHATNCTRRENRVVK